MKYSNWHTKYTIKETEENTQWKVAKELGIKESLDKLRKNVALQGELVGEGINKNPLKIKGQEWHLFDVYDIDRKRYMTPKERREFIRLMDNSKIKHVPVLNERIKIFEICSSMDTLLYYAEGQSRLNKSIEREGIVFKSNELVDGQVLSFKVINNDYLLKYEE